MPKYSVARSITIESDAKTVFDRVVDYSTWSTWSPWLCAEPDAKVTVSQNSNSVGSTYSWEGNITGAGELEHMRLDPGQHIEDEIRFLKPFKSTSRVSFDFQPSGAGTEVTWRMDGSLPWFMFWMKPMMESFIAMDYDRGLSMMKEWIETGKILSETQNKGVQSIGPISMVGVRNTCDFKKIGESMEKDIAKACDEFDRHGVSKDKGMISVYHDFNIKKQIMDYTTGFIVDQPVDIPGMNSWEIGRVKALQVNHVGSYDNLGNAWNAANMIARAKKLKQSKAGAFELYPNDPSNTEPAALITEIYLPLK